LRRTPREIVADLLARALVASLFTRLCIELLNDFLRTGHVTGLMLLASELLVVVLTVFRRPAQVVDRSLLAFTVTALTVIGPPLFRASESPGLLSDSVTAGISMVGLLVVIVGKISIGRSFGIVPANRGVVVRGPYTLVRHPIYTGYLITYIAFVLAHPRPWNLAILLCAGPAFAVRALLEERVLSRDDTYRAYCERVGWHLVPGVF
jgi:protein-S-isoprenylcysteine O-methyltransferase Ste14